MTRSPSTIPYAFCTPHECDERQALGQVSVLESTVETCHYDSGGNKKRQPSKRILDPCLAVAKYRRSAAGTQQIGRTQVQLEQTLHHLLEVYSIQAATCQHFPPTTLYITAEFLVDRLRGCQADAIRLLGDGERLSSSSSSSSSSWVSSRFQVQLIRTLILLRYLLQGHSQYPLLAQTTHTMLWTALADFWTCRELEWRNQGNDHDFFCNPCDDYQDEVLTYSSLLHLANCVSHPETHTPGWILSQYTRHVDSSNRYPMWHRCALAIASCIVREDYRTILHIPTMTVLQKMCLASCLVHLRYHTLQSYNSSFGKGEAVDDLDRLLGCPMRRIVQECQRYNLPIEEKNGATDDDNWEDVPPSQAVIFKAVPMVPLSSSSLPSSSSSTSSKSNMTGREDEWVFGNETSINFRTDEDGILIPCTAWMRTILLLDRIETSS